MTLQPPASQRQRHQQTLFNILRGQEATQQIIAGLDWIAKEKGAKTFYLIGSDYIWPRTSNKIARKHIENVLKGTVVGEEYYALGSTSFGSLINKIKLKKPDVIYAVVVGGSNVSFYKQLKAAGITSDKQTLLTLSTTEDEVLGIGGENLVGFYSAMKYFQSLQNTNNAAFVKAFKAKYGEKSVIGDVTQAAYLGPWLWKATVEKCDPVSTKIQSTPGIPDFMDWNQSTHLPAFWVPFKSLPFTLLAVIGLPLVIALIVGLAMFKRRVGGVYFAVITQALALLLSLGIDSKQGDTGGRNGITDRRTMWGWDIRSQPAQYILYFTTCVLLLLCIVLSQWLLSGGQQQQLAIARALVSNPKVLVLDEPTEGIQPSIIKDIAKALKEIRKMRQLAIVVSEQVVSFMLEVCDRAIVIERGRFIHEAPRANLDADKVKALLAV